MIEYWPLNKAYGVERWDLSSDGRDPRIAYQSDAAIGSTG